MKVALFIPCYVDAFFPEVGIATLELLERLGVERRLSAGPDLLRAAHGQQRLRRRCRGHRRRCSSRSFTRLRLHRDAVGQLHASRPRAPRRRFRKPRTCARCGSPCTSWSSSCTTSCACASSLGRVPARRRACTTAARRCARCALAKMSEIAEPRVLEAARSAFRREGHPLRRRRSGPDECCGFGGTFSVFEEPVSARMGYDKVNDHHKAGAEYIVSGDMSCLMHQKGCAERLGLPHQVHPHRADPERSSMSGSRRVTSASTTPRRRRSSSRRRITSTSTTNGCGTCARSATAKAKRCRNGRSCARSLPRSRSTRSPTSPTTSSSSSATRSQTARRCTGRPTRPSTTRSCYDILRSRGARTLVKAKSMLTDECEMRPVPRASRHRGDGDRPRRAHPATRRRAAEPHRRAGGPQAARRRRAGLLRDDRHRPEEQRRPLPRREPAPAHAAVFPAARTRA